MPESQPLLPSQKRIPQGRNMSHCQPSATPVGSGRPASTGPNGQSGRASTPPRLTPTADDKSLDIGDGGIHGPPKAGINAVRTAPVVGANNEIRESEVVSKVVPSVRDQPAG